MPIALFLPGMSSKLLPFAPISPEHKVFQGWTRGTWCRRTLTSHGLGKVGKRNCGGRVSEISGLLARKKEEMFNHSGSMLEGHVKASTATENSYPPRFKNRSLTKPDSLFFASANLCMRYAPVRVPLFFLAWNLGGCFYEASPPCLRTTFRRMESRETFNLPVLDKGFQWSRELVQASRKMEPWSFHL